MSKFPIAVSIVVLCLLIAIGQNLSPSISIVFLGTTSMAFPLGVWVGLAIAAGALTAIAIHALFRGVGSSRSKIPRASIGASTPPRAPDRAQRTWDDRTVAEPMGDRRDPPFEVTTDEVTTDEGYEPRTGQLPEDEPAEAWDDEEEWVGTDVAQGQTDGIYTQDSPVKVPDFEVKKEPIPTYQEGSVYSFSYRDEKTDAGTTDDIYAAADDEQNEVPKATPVQPEEDPLEPELVDPFPDPFPEAFEVDSPQPASERSGKSPASEDGDDWMNSSKANRDDW